MPFYVCPRERSGHAGSVKRLRYEPIYAWASAVESKAPQSAHFRRGLKPSRRWVFLLGYTALGNESNSDASGKCYWWLRSATARREVAKIVPLTERLSRVAAPGSRLKGVLAKATCAHQRAA